MRKYVISGGPGVGKTTILNHIEQDGHPIIRETARTIIRYEQRYAPQQNREPILPWTNIETFQYHVILRQIYKEQQLEKRAEYGFLDRGIIDNLGYARNAQFTITPTIRHHIEQANYDTVFFLEQLNHYETDRERREDSELATKIHEALRETYQEQNIQFISIQDIGITERVNYIYEQLINQQHTPHTGEGGNALSKQYREKRAWAA